MFKALIKEKHIKQEDIARELNVTQSSISLWCSGKAYPTLDKVPALACLLNVSIEELVNALIKTKGGCA